MRLSFANDRLLAVMAHPDDAELLCAGTLARAQADGAAIGILVMCRGDKGVGSFTASGEALSNARREEASAAETVIVAPAAVADSGKEKEEISKLFSQM